MSELAKQSANRSLWDRSRRLPLGVQLIGLVLVAVVLPLAAYLAVAMPMYHRALVESNSDKLALQSGQAARELDRFFSRRITCLPLQAEFLESDDIPAIDRHLFDIHESDRELYGIMAVDASDQLISIAGEMPEQAANKMLTGNGVPQLLEKCRNAVHGDVFVSDAFMTDLGPATLFATPVSEDSTGKITKVYLVVIPLSRPQEIISEFAQGLSGIANVHLVNSSRKVVCSTDESVTFLQTFAGADGRPGFAEHLDLANESGSFQFLNSHGDEVVAGFASLSAAGNNNGLAWNVIAELPVSVISLPALETRNRLLVIGLIVALVSVFLAFVLTRRITLPLIDVARAAKRLSRGEFDVPLPTSLVPEANEISAALQLMSDSIAKRSRELTESEKRYRSLVELIPVGLQRCDVNGRLTFANAALARIFSFTTDELKEKYIWDFEADEQASLEFQQYFQMLVTEQPKPAAYIRKNKTGDGRIIDVRVDWIYERNSMGELLSFVSSISDITESLRAEREVLSINEELERTHRQAKLGSWKLNVETGHGCWSPELFRIFERDASLSPPEFDEFLNQIHPEDRQQVVVSWQRMMENQPDSRLHFRCIAADGSDRHLLGVHRGDILTESNGQKYLSGTIQDITELKLAEQSLRDSEEKYRLITESAFDGVVVLVEGRVVEVNRAFEAMFGYMQEELIGETLSFVISAESMNLLNHIMANGLDELFEIECAHKSGYKIDVEIFCRSMLFRDKQACIVAMRDITERKLLDRQQAELFNRNAAIVSAFGEIVYQWNIREDRISLAGDYLGILGCGTEQVGSTYEAWIARVHPDDVDLLLAEINAAKNENRLCDFECRMQHVDGHYVWTHNRGVLFCNIAGELENIIGVIRDITQRRKQQDELRALNFELEQRVVERTLELGAANEDLEAYAHSVAHDLRAPLRAMYGFSRALSEDYADKLDDTGREYTGFIEQASQQMDELISDLLEYSKVGRCEVSNEILDLNEVVRKAIFQLSAEISQSYAELSIQPSLGSIVGNRSMLVQVVVNLVSNAIKFVHDGVTPQIRIWSDQNSHSLCLWVEDNGIGVKPEFQKRIFKVFERLHGIETFPGTGIGLAIVRRAVESMGGRVGMESAPHNGSRFWVELPVNQVVYCSTRSSALAMANN